MKLRYETGIAAFVQFVIVSLLALITQINTIVVGCIRKDGQCVENIIPSIWYFILTAIVFGLIWMLGYMAQERRTKWLVLGLILMELGVARVAYHNARHYTDILGLVASLINLALALWVVFLAIRLFRSKGGRVVTSRPRQRRSPTTRQ